MRRERAAAPTPQRPYALRRSSPYARRRKRSRYAVRAACVTAWRYHALKLALVMEPITDATLSAFIAAKRAASCFGIRWSTCSIVRDVTAWVVMCLLTIETPLRAAALLF